MQNLSSGFVEGSCAVVITTTPFIYQKVLKYILLSMAVWWGCISRREKSRDGGGALMSNLVSHCRFDLEKRTVPGSSNLNLSLSGA